MALDKLAVVRKLLVKAERAATPAEAEAYTAKALALMARHGIDAALAAAAVPERDGVGTTRVAIHDPYSAGKGRLLAWTASALRCRAVLHEVGGGRVEAVSIVGFAADRARAEVLFTSLLLQAGGQLARSRPSRAGESVAAFRRSWLHGFAAAVHERLVAAESAAARERDAERGAGAPSVALVLADRTDRVERAFAAEFPAVARARRRALAGSGFGAGVAAGVRADLGGTAVSGPGRPALRR